MGEAKSNKAYTFSELFDLDEIQHLQDSFADATGVASIITDPDGKPLTKPSNFCRLCAYIIRGTPLGLLNCMKSDAILGQKQAHGPTLCPCLSGGLWDAGASICIGERHIANWLIGQVLTDEKQEQRVLDYVRLIGADEQQAMIAIKEVTRMPLAQFRKIAEFLSLNANMLSKLAMQNARQRAQLQEEKRMEQELRRSEERFRSIVQSSPMGIHAYQLDAQNRLILVEANKAADRFTGIETQALLGKTIEDAFPALVGTIILDKYRQAASQGIPWQMSDIEYHDNKIHGLFDVAAFQTAPGQMAVMFMEVSDRRQALLALKQSEDRLQLALKVVSDGVWDWDISNQKIYFSPACYKMLGYAYHEFPPLYEEWQKRAHPDDSANMHKHLYHHFQDPNYSYVVEVRVRNKAGDWQWILTRGQVVERDKQGNPTRMIGTHSDIMARKQEQEQKAHMEKQLRQMQKMEAIGQLAGGIAHDFNNMLQAILGYTMFLHEEVAQDSQAYQDVVQIKQTVDRAAILTRQLLTFSRPAILKPESANLNDVIANLHKMLQRLLGEHIEIKLQYDVALKKIHADVNQIEQVLLNLCINARDAMPQGGAITIVTRNVFFDDTYCQTHAGMQSGEYVQLEVSDTGTGIPVELRDRIFEPFFTTKEVGKGTGLGLATVYAIVRKHGGMIRFYSEVGHGTTFRIYLPVAIGDTPKNGTTTLPILAEGGHETILLVEDDPAVRGLALRVLKNAGYRILVAANGEEALFLLAERDLHIDMVILDVVMPKASGRQVYETMRGTGSGMPVLFSSGYSPHMLEKNLLPEPQCELLQKPYSPQQLLLKVRELLNQARTQHS